jgi:LacI family transcriptional regulator
MPTIRDVASLAGVSVGTVSKVLTGSGQVGDERRTRVQRAIRELEYVPDPLARSLKTRQTRMLGAIISDITNPFYPQLVRGAEDAAMKRHFLLITVNTDDRAERERELVSLLLARKVDGLLLVSSPHATDRSHIARAQKQGIPIVALDRLPEGVALDAVLVNNLRGARMCMHHLLRQGHRRIAYLGGDWDLNNARDRLRGYQEGLKEAGIPVEQALIGYGDFRQETGYRLTKDLCLQQDPPTAIFAANGMMGLGALKALRELGLRCPEDVALALFDDLPFAEAVEPHLTAVAQPAYEIGRRGAELLIDRIEKRQTSKKPVLVELEPELIVRSSTGPARMNRINPTSKSGA